MGELFNNLLSTRQIQIIYAILDVEKIRLYTMIKAIG